MRLPHQILAVVCLASAPTLSFADPPCDSGPHCPALSNDQSQAVEDCYTLHGLSREWQRANINECEYTWNQYEMVQAYLANPEVLHRIAVRLRDAERVSYLERENEYYFRELRAADLNNDPDSKYVLRAVIPETNKLNQVYVYAFSCALALVIASLVLTVGWLFKRATRRTNNHA